MYRVLKSRERTANVMVENTETKANIVIGQLNTKILKLLEEAGVQIGEGYEIQVTDEWNFPVGKATAQNLVRLTIPIKKPIRDQSIKAKEPKKNIDAMDVLLGLAQYN